MTGEVGGPSDRSGPSGPCKGGAVTRRDGPLGWAGRVADRATRRFDRRPPKPGHPPWNHNIAYHRVVLAAAPRPCHRALDVGCGQGLLLVDLAPVADQVLGLDVDEATLTAAGHLVEGLDNVTLLHGDVLTAELPVAGFDLVTAVAVLHHLPLEAGLARLADLVRPGGALVVVGHRRERGVVDALLSIAAFPAANALVLRRGHTAVDAPIRDPEETFAEIRAAAARIVPGARLRRRLLFRYTLTWTRPAA